MVKSLFRKTVAVFVPGLLGAGLLAQAPGSEAATTAGRTAPQAGQPSPAHGAHGRERQAGDRLADPAAVLGPRWRASRDRAIAVAGDATGLHVLVANATNR